MSEEEFGWKFEKSESGDVEGLNDGNIETFRDDHLLSLAKESAQNTLDNREDKSKPVILEFNSFNIDQKNFPDIENYKNMIDLQIKYWGKTKKDRSSEYFFKEAKKAINSEKILCLRISDFNTTGLEGSQNGINDSLTRWWKLVRSTGVTDNDPLAGGSFGLGKFASFACSKLRTAFYSTKDLDGLESHQGVSILASHDTKEGKRTRRRGYFCNLSDFSCIRGPLRLDPDFSRRSPGTDIYIIGFMDDKEELEEKLFSSILRSFLLAIYDGNLIFRLNGKNLEKSNLKERFDKYSNEIYDHLDLRETIEYYDILEGNLKSESYYLSMFEENDVLLKIAVETGLSKRVGMFRNNGMKIFDRKGGGSYGDFSGVLSLKGDKVNAYFRKLENPEHDYWRHERSSDPKEAKEKINELYRFIRKSLKELENKTMPESENMEGIDSLPDEVPEEEGIEPLEGLNFKPLKIRESKRKRKVKNNIKIFVPGGNEGKGKLKRERPGDGKGKSGPGEDINEKAIREISPENIKVFRDKDGSYNLLFSFSEELKSLKCKVFIGGEEFNEMVEIEKASILKNGGEINLRFTGNEIELGSLGKNSFNHIKFKIKEDEKWALEVRLYED